MLLQSLSDAPVRPFVMQQAEQSFYYSPAWLDLIPKLYGYKLIPLTTTNADGQVTGFLPLCFMQSPLTGSRLVSLPFSDYCPLLAEDENSANSLIDQAIRLAQQKRVRYLELRSGLNEVLAKRSDMVRSDLYVHWLMTLAPDPDTLWSSLRKPIQHQIKKAQKLGVQVRMAQTREEVAHYYRLHLQTRCKKHGMPAQPQRYFFNVWDALAASGKLQLLLAEHEGKVIASMILFASGTTVQYAYGASDDQYLNLAPNNLLMWTAISWGCTHGYATLDMGRTSCDNEGLMEFKRRWGAVKEPLPYYYYPRMEGLATTSEHSWKFRLLTSCWRRLPLQIAGPLGGSLYKHLG
jgi:FemAB-related protein (PEP-CTERM system-associated)